MSPLDITGAGLIRALWAAVRPMVDEAMRKRAGTIAEEVGGAGGDATVMRRGEGEYEVTVSRTLSSRPERSEEPGPRAE